MQEIIVKYLKITFMVFENYAEMCLKLFVTYKNKKKIQDKFLLIMR